MLPRVRFWTPWTLSVGENSWMADDVDCYCVAPITVGRNVVVSQGAFLCTASHDVSSPTFELKTAPIVIQDQAWIAARAIILPGVTIGEGAVVAAGSVVAKDVPPWTIVAGNPARQIGKRELR